jgi:tetratricopeptide (TPR) repeat protein
MQNSLIVTRTLAAVALLGVAASAGCARSGAADALEAMREGDQFIEAGQPLRAVEAYERAVKVAPNDAQARAKLSRAYEGVGRWGPAAAEAARAADLQPGDLDAKLRAASLVLNVRRFEDAANMASSVLRERPDDPQALVVVANATARLPNIWHALNLLAPSLRPERRFHEERIKIRPPVSPESDRTAEEILRKLARATSEAEPQIALANLLWATGRPEDSAELLRALADRLPQNQAVNHALGAYYLSRDRIADGEKYLKQAAATAVPENRVSRWMLVGHYEYHRRDAEALALLEQMLADRLSFTEASLRSAAIFWRQQRLGEALGRVDALLARHAKEPRALAMKAQVLYAVGNFSGAAEVARAALAVDPDSSRGHFALGQSLAATGNVDDAFTELRHAVRLEPSALDIPVVATRLALATQQYALALEYGRESARKRPGEEEPAFAIVAAHLGLRQFAEAETALQPLLKRHAESFEAYVLLGRIREAQGRRPAARDAYRRAAELNPGSLEALGGLVALDLAERNTSAARARVHQALARNPDEAGYLQLASRVFHADGDVAQSEAMLRRALILDPARIGAAMQLAALLEGQHRQKEALAVLRTGLQMRPAATEARTQLGRLLESIGQPNEARAEYERVLVQDSAAVVAATRLALLQLADGGNPDETLRLLARARQRAPTDPDVSHALGVVHVQGGRVKVAIPYLEEASRVRPQDPTFWYVLGTAYAADKQPAKAREALTRALAIDAPFPERDQARAALDALR